MINDNFSGFCYIFIFFILLFLLYKLYQWWNRKELLKCRYHFSKPYVGKYTFKMKEVFVIDNESVATEAGKILCKKKILYVDCEGQEFGSKNSVLCIVQIATDKNCCYIFDVVTCPESLLVLKELFESEGILKIFHDCSGDIAALQNATVDAPVMSTGGRYIYERLEEGELGIHTRNVGDTQIAYKVMHGEYYSLANLYSFYDKKKNFPKVHVPSYGTENKWIYHRPLTEEMIKYAAIDVLVMPEIYQKQIKKISKYHYMAEYNAAVNERKVCKTRRF